jgi:hypothetical protein
MSPPHPKAAILAALEPLSSWLKGADTVEKLHYERQYACRLVVGDIFHDGATTSSAECAVL